MRRSELGGGAAGLRCSQSWWRRGYLFEDIAVCLRRSHFGGGAASLRRSQSWLGAAIFLSKMFVLAIVEKYVFPSQSSVHAAMEHIEGARCSP